MVAGPGKRTVTLGAIFVSPVAAAAVASHLLGGGVDAVAIPAGAVVGAIAVTAYVAGHRR